MESRIQRVSIKCELTNEYFYVDPTSPQDVKVFMIDSTSLNVTWQPPQEENGKILHYVIHYQRVGSSKKFSVVATATERQKVIIDLKPYTNYSIYVVANTSAGYGNKSDERFERTDQAGVLKLVLLMLAIPFLKISLNVFAYRLIISKKRLRW